MRLALVALVAAAIVGGFVALLYAAGGPAEFRRQFFGPSAVERRLAAVEAHVAEVDAAIARHEHDAWETAEAYRQRCEWSMVPAETRRGLMEAVLLRPARGEPVVVSFAR